MAQKPLQYLNGKLTEVEASTSSVGVPSAGKIIALNSQGKLDPSFFSPGFLRNVNVSYADEGMRSQRIIEMDFESVDDSSQTLSSVISWLDIGKMNQRIEKEILTGSLVSGRTLEKNYLWRLVGIRYVLDGFDYQIL